MYNKVETSLGSPGGSSPWGGWGQGGWGSKIKPSQGRDLLPNPDLVLVL